MILEETNIGTSKPFLSTVVLPEQVRLEPFLFPLGDGRYRWRHDQVLKTIAEAINAGLAWAKQLRPSQKTIAFVRAGDKPTPNRRTSAGILTSARDWQLLVDLDLEHQLKFPSHIAVTTLQPDIVLSESTKQAVDRKSVV